MKVYYSIICLIIAAFSTNGCKKSESSDNKIPDNNEINTTAEFFFISKLSEETLLAQEREYKLTRDFLKNSFKDKESFYVAYMDRTDNSGLIYTHKLALDTDTWTSFAMNSHRKLPDLTMPSSKCQLSKAVRWQ